ncbi:AAA family ATPase, partial [Streptomyces sp. NPDC048279]|uniref:AAA family ATPase n=1 Tax=Streptomyces sp. NPDC048279 TaxID=3154714 RepID=UPI0034433804
MSMVRGAPGIGKTALLAEAAALAEGLGYRVLSTSGAEAESDIPYAGLQLVLRPLDAGAADLAAPHRKALDTALGRAEAGVPDVFLVGLAVLNLLADAAAVAPVLVLADDVQWLDDATVGVLAFVARRAGAEPVVMVGAAREGYRSRLNADEVTSVTLDPLTDGQAAELLADRAPDLRPTAHRRLLAEAAGNPLALTELSRTLGALADPHLSRLPLTERLERAFTDRLETLPDITRGLLRIAALDDSPSLPEIYRATREFTGTTAGSAELEPAVRARLVQVVGTELRFGHPLMRSAIHQTMPHGVRHAAHAALAAVLDADPDRQTRHRADELAVLTADLQLENRFARVLFGTV